MLYFIFSASKPERDQTVSGGVNLLPGLAGLDSVEETHGKTMMQR